MLFAKEDVRCSDFRGINVYNICLPNRVCNSDSDQATKISVLNKCPKGYENDLLNTFCVIRV